MMPVGFLLAWRNTTHRKPRTWLTVAALSVSLMFLFVEVGFERMSRRAHTLLFERLDFDLVVVSDAFESIKDIRHLSANRLAQAAAVSGVDAAARLNINWGVWVDRKTHEQSDCMIIGVDINPLFIRDDEIRRNLGKLQIGNQVILDRLSDPGAGLTMPDEQADISGHRVTVAGHFTMGSDFKSDVRAITGQSAFYRLTGNPPERVSLGLLKVKPGENVQLVRDRLTGLLPGDVYVIDRSSFLAEEQNYYTRVKPIGIFFYAGMIVSFITGAVILFQTLATDLMIRLREFAMLAALGFSPSYIHATGLWQAFIYGAISFPISFLLSYALFSVVTYITRLPHAMSLSLFITVFALSAAMCLAAGLAALQKVRRTAPADLL